MENEEYPQEVEDRIPSEWGKYLSIHPEWYSLVSTVDALISEVAPDYVIHQVKEKFGGLRFYIDKSSVPEEKQDYVEGVIRMAEAYSYKI